MPFMLKVLAEEGYVLLEHHGHVPSDEVREARAALLDAAGREKFGRVLIDWSAASGVPPVADFYFILSETRITLDVRGKCALLTPESSRSVADFVETAGRNRGFRIKAFTSREAAIEWLFRADDSH
ncbi:MAG TPA: hypothetical protein VIM81_09735 [Gammaproteobacteria bacterium]